VLVVGAACSRLPLAAANAIGNAAAASSSGPNAAGPEAPRNPAANGSKRQSKTSKPSSARTVAAAGGVVKVVADDWIQACADAGRLLPTDEFEAAVRRRAADATAGAAAEAARAREGAEGGQLAQYRWGERGVRPGVVLISEIYGFVRFGAAMSMQVPVKSTLVPTSR
jgi:hypothetical protein